MQLYATPLNAIEQSFYSRLPGNFQTKKDALDQIVQKNLGGNPRRVASFAAHLRSAMSQSTEEVILPHEMRAWTKQFRKEAAAREQERQQRIANCDAGDTAILDRIQNMIASRSTKFGQLFGQQPEQKIQAYFPNY